MNIDRPQSTTPPPPASTSNQPVQSSPTTPPGALAGRDLSQALMAPGEYQALVNFIRSSYDEATASANNITCYIPTVTPQQPPTTTAPSVTLSLIESVASLTVKQEHESGAECEIKPVLTKKQKKKFRQRELKTMLAASSDVSDQPISQPRQTRRVLSPELKKKTKPQTEPKAEGSVAQPRDLGARPKVKPPCGPPLNRPAEQPKPPQPVPNCIEITPTYGNKTFTVLRPSKAYLKNLVDYRRPDNDIVKNYQTVNRFCNDIKKYIESIEQGLRKQASETKIKLLQKRIPEFEGIWNNLIEHLNISLGLANHDCDSYKLIEQYVNCNVEDVKPNIGKLTSLLKNSYSKPQPLKSLLIDIHYSVLYLYWISEVLSTMAEVFTKYEVQSKTE